MDKAQACGDGAKKPILVKLVLVGKVGVGKSAMIVRFLTKRFIGEYDPNVGSIYHHHTRLENQDVRVEILESGGKDYIEKNDVHALWGDAFVLVYAVDDRTSFEELTSVRNHLEKVREADHSVLVLVGNKREVGSDRVEVSKQDGNQLAEKLNCLAFHEVSTKASYQDIEFVFIEAIRETMKYKMTQRVLNGARRSSHSKIMEMVEKNVSRNRAMSSLKETIDEYCATRTEELTRDLSRDRSSTFT